MPPGFGVLDTILVSIPVMLALLGLIRGAQVELASCIGCVAGVAAAWALSMLPPLHALGQPVAPLLALAGGVVAWRLTRGLCGRLGLDSRFIELGRYFDWLAGFAMGGIRGIAMVSAACLAYAMIFVPLGLASPTQTVAYPVFLAVGSQVTSAVIAKAEPIVGAPGGANTLDTMATVPMPLAMPSLAQAAAPVAAPVPNLASYVRIIAPAAAAPVPPVMFRAADIPVRQMPVSLIETHHNILHPRGLFVRHAHR